MSTPSHLAIRTISQGFKQEMARQETREYIDAVYGRQRVSRRAGIAIAAVLVAVAVAAGCSQQAPRSSQLSGEPPSGPAAAVPPCSASLLFEAAEAGQHFSSDPARYPQVAGHGPGAYNPACDGTWAIALVSHPEVGTTDSEVLFRARAGSWTRVKGIGGVQADWGCSNLNLLVRVLV